MFCFDLIFCWLLLFVSFKDKNAMTAFIIHFVFVTFLGMYFLPHEKTELRLFYEADRLFASIISFFEKVLTEIICYNFKDENISWKNKSKLSRKQRQYDYIYIFFLTYNHVMYCVMSKKSTVATFFKSQKSHILTPYG